MRIVSFCLVVVLLFSPVAFGYGPWQQEDDEFSEITALLDRLDAAIAQATAGRSAHPDFLKDLTELAAKLRQAKDQLSQGESSDEWGSYGAISAPDVSGEWNVVGNGFAGVLVINQSGNTISGTIYGDPLDNATISNDGSISFVRSGPNQVWTGKVITEGGVTKLAGTFDCPVTGGKGLNWVAARR